MRSHKIIIAIVIAAAAISASLFLGSRVPSAPAAQATGETNNISVENGKQIVAIAVRGGYSPRLTTAKAGMPTVLRMKTNGTFDCSSAVVISSLNIFKNLAITGQSDIEIPAQKAGSTLQGTCAMGMYNFAINFE